MTIVVAASKGSFGLVDIIIDNVRATVDKDRVLQAPVGAGTGQDHLVVQDVQRRRDGDSEDGAEIDVLAAGEIDVDRGARKLGVEHGEAVHVHGQGVANEINQAKAEYDVVGAVVVAP